MKLTKKEKLSVQSFRRAMELTGKLIEGQEHPLLDEPIKKGCGPQSVAESTIRVVVGVEKAEEIFREARKKSAVEGHDYAGLLLETAALLQVLRKRK